MEAIIWQFSYLDSGVYDVAAAVGAVPAAAVGVGDDAHGAVGIALMRSFHIERHDPHHAPQERPHVVQGLVTRWTHMGLGHGGLRMHSLGALIVVAELSPMSRWMTLPRRVRARGWVHR